MLSFFACRRRELNRKNLYESGKKIENIMFDEWSGLADILANLIEKYAADLDIGNMPDTKIDMENKEELLEKEQNPVLQAAQS